VDGARHHSVAFQSAQCGGQHALRDTGVLEAENFAVGGLRSSRHLGRDRVDERFGLGIAILRREGRIRARVGLAIFTLMSHLPIPVPIPVNRGAPSRLALMLAEAGRAHHDDHPVRGVGGPRWSSPECLRPGDAAYTLEPACAKKSGRLTRADASRTVFFWSLHPLNPNATRGVPSAWPDLGVDSLCQISSRRGWSKMIMRLAILPSRTVK
jgi:hypothetical protein